MVNTTSINRMKQINSYGDCDLSYQQELVEKVNEKGLPKNWLIKWAELLDKDIIRQIKGLV